MLNINKYGYSFTKGWISSMVNHEATTTTTTTFSPFISLTFYCFIIWNARSIRMFEFWTNTLLNTSRSKYSFWGLRFASTSFIESDAIPSIGSEDHIRTIFRSYVCMCIGSEGKRERFYFKWLCSIVFNALHLCVYNFAKSSMKIMFHS